jgi:hypothetical protein
LRGLGIIGQDLMGDTKAGSLWQTQQSDTQQPVLKITKVEGEQVWYIILDDGWINPNEPKPLLKSILTDRYTELSKKQFVKMVLKGEYSRKKL